MSNHDFIRIKLVDEHLAKYKRYTLLLDIDVNSKLANKYLTKKISYYNIETYISNLFYTIINDDLSTFKDLLNEFPELMNSKIEYYCSMLNKENYFNLAIYLIDKKKFTMMKYLVDIGYDFTNKFPKNYNILDLCVKKYKYITWEDDKDNSADFYYAVNRNIDLINVFNFVEYILKRNKMTISFKAIETISQIYFFNYYNLLNLLFEYSVEIDCNNYDNDGILFEKFTDVTPNDDSLLLERFVKKNLEYINKIDFDKDSRFYLNIINTIFNLINHGCDVNMKNSSGQTFLHFLITKKHPLCLYILYDILK